MEASDFARRAAAIQRSIDSFVPENERETKARVYLSKLCRILAEDAQRELREGRGDPYEPTPVLRKETYGVLKQLVNSYQPNHRVYETAHEIANLFT